MRLGRIGIFALLISSLAGTLAVPAHAQRGIGNLLGLRHAALEQEAPPSEQPLPPQAAQQPRVRAFGQADASIYEAQNESLSQESRSVQRVGRLTPEERRALRRQIGEVGHDIDMPRR
jgi:hypothetical protein